MLKILLRARARVISIMMVNEGKRKNIDYEQFELFDKTDKNSKLDGETKKDEEPLPKWLRSKNDFKGAIKLIEDIRADTNNIKSSGDKKVFNDLYKLINGIKKKLQEKIPLKKQRTLFLI